MNKDNTDIVEDNIKLTVHPDLLERWAIEKLAWEAWEEDQKTNPNCVNPYSFVYGYFIGYKKAKIQSSSI